MSRGYGFGSSTHFEEGNPVGFSEALLQLCRDPARARAPDLWNCLPAEEQKRALSLAVEESASARADLASRFVRSQGGFRLASVREWPAAVLVEKALRHRILTGGLMHMAIVQLHVKDRSDLQAALFTQLGLPHADGVPLASIPEPAAPAAALAAATATLLSDDPSDRTLFYLLALRTLIPKSWFELSTPLRELAEHELPAAHETAHPEPPQQVETAAVEERAATSPDAGAERTPPRREDVASAAELEPVGEEDAFTELDELLMRAIEDTANQIQGALEPTQLDEALLELSRLNGTRARTHFHLGLRDVSFGRSVAPGATNGRGPRWTWYFAGFVSGLHDAGEHGLIVDLFEKHEEVKRLGKSTTGPSEVAGHMLFRALCRRGRFAEATDFLALDAIAASSTLQEALLDEATDLVRAEQYDQALPMLKALEGALKSRMSHGLHVPRDRWNDTRRRLATCLRFVGAPGAGIRLLEEILAEREQSADNRAAVLADLGLEEAGFARLHALHLPDHAGGLKDIAFRLSERRTRFEEALALDSDLARHADYVLGFLALVQGLAASADRNHYLKIVIPRLGGALGQFEKRPDVYGGGKLISRARLHLGIAYCLAWDEARLPRAKRLLETALQESLAPPPYLLERVLGVFEATLRSGESIDGIVDKVLQARPELLDAIVKLEYSVTAPLLPMQLLDRASDTRRSLEQRSTDRLTAFSCLRRQGRLDEAGQVLDELERDARHQVGGDDFLDLLSDREAIQDIWPDEEVMKARAIVLESRRDFVGAADAWGEYAHRLMTIATDWALDNAETAIDRVKGLGPEFEADASALAARLASLTPSESSPITAARIKAHVLIVGGDEQSRKEIDQISDEVAARAPGVTLEFMTTGFTSNWGRLVEDFERRVSRADAVVLNYLMRTNFGRTVRRLCDGKPWRSCDTRGRGKMIERILAVAATASS